MRRLLICVFLLCAHIFGVALFCSGFFPQKIPVSGHNTLEDIPANAFGSKTVPQRRFGRLVIMVVDALRSEFITTENSNFPFTKKLITDKKVYNFRSIAQTPTVTLPRIKALTSGRVPSFMDFVMNFNSRELKDDNFVTQLHRAGRNLVFYGDDTWLKLFPGHFMRADGTTSFFVMDTVEVDNNVTRHIVPELSQHDWDVMIMHFLGLDHVGHMGGPRSRLMPPKQREMDGIVRLLHESLLEGDRESEQPSLFILLSDHGMTESGNHGGSSDEEVYTTLLFASSAFEAGSAVGRGSPQSAAASRGGEVFQIDLVPTLSLLFGLPIPRNSFGVLIPELLTSVMPPGDFLRCLEINAHQLLQILHADPLLWYDGRPATPAIAELVSKWEAAQALHRANASSEQAADLYLQFMRGLQQDFTRALSSYDLYAIWAAIVLLGLTAAVSLLIGVRFFFIADASGSIPTPSSRTFLALCLCTAFVLFASNRVLCWWLRFDSVLCSSFLLLAAYTAFVSLLTAALLSFLPAVALVPLLASQLRATWSPEQLFVLGGSVTHMFSLVSSSSIEEEHQIWFFFSGSLQLLLLYLAYTRFKSAGSLQQLRSMLPVVGLLVCGRLVHNWNASGNKWLNAGLDYATWLNGPSSLQRSVLSSLMVLGMGAPAAFAVVYTSGHADVIDAKTRYLFDTACAVAAVLTASYKFDPAPSVISVMWLARGVYAACLVSWMAAVLFPFWKTRLKAQEVQTLLHVVPTLCLVSFTQLLLLLHKPHNLFLFAVMGFQALCVVSIAKQRIVRDRWTLLVMLYWLGQCAFFGLGNSNSISSLDISGAYTGLSGYNEIICGTLSAIIGSSGHLFFFLASLAVLGHLASRSTGSQRPWSVGTYLLFAWLTYHIGRSSCFFIYSVIVTLHRHHLFIWSVFSPKLIFEVFYTIFDLVKCASLLAVGLYHRRLVGWAPRGHYHQKSG